MHKKKTRLLTVDAATLQITITITINTIIGCCLFRSGLCPFHMIIIIIICLVCNNFVTFVTHCVQTHFEKRSSLRKFIDAMVRIKMVTNHLIFMQQFCAILTIIIII